MTDLIETRIRQYYCVNGGEWLVEKGKVKEAKLLKEACENIEKLRRQCETSNLNHYRLMMSTSQKERELESREKEIAERENRLRDRIESAKQGLEYMLEKM